MYGIHHEVGALHFSWVPVESGIDSIGNPRAVISAAEGRDAEPRSERSDTYEFDGD